jgi:hypothetical protein
VGLWGEDGRPLAPSVVVPHHGAGVVEAELGGPATLPPGAEIRCIADTAEGDAVVVTIGTDRRRGLHAFLHGDLRIPCSSAEPTAAALDKAATARLARAYPWLVPNRPPEPARTERRAGGDRRRASAEARAAHVPASDAAGAPAKAQPDPSEPADVLDMLRDLGVDVDDMDEDLLDSLRSGES